MAVLCLVAHTKKTSHMGSAESVHLSLPNDDRDHAGHWSGLTTGAGVTLL